MRLYIFNLHENRGHVFVQAGFCVFIVLFSSGELHTVVCAGLARQTAQLSRARTEKWPRRKRRAGEPAISSSNPEHTRHKAAFHRLRYLSEQQHNKHKASLLEIIFLRVDIRVPLEIFPFNSELSESPKKKWKQSNCMRRTAFSRRIGLANNRQAAGPSRILRHVLISGPAKSFGEKNNYGKATERRST